MTGLEKMMEWLRYNKIGDKPVRSFRGLCMVKASSLLAEEHSQKPTAPAGLIEELSKFCTEERNNLAGISNIKLDKIEAIVSKYKPESIEPLAVLAANKHLIDMCHELLDLVQEAKYWDRDGDPLENYDIHAARKQLSILEGIKKDGE